jgi:hypothetical protein
MIRSGAKPARFYQQSSRRRYEFAIRGRQHTISDWRLPSLCPLSEEKANVYCGAIIAGFDPQQTLGGLFCCAAQHSSLYARARSST